MDLFWYATLRATRTTSPRGAGSPAVETRSIVWALQPVLFGADWAYVRTIRSGDTTAALVSLFDVEDVGEGLPGPACNIKPTTGFR